MLCHASPQLESLPRPRPPARPGAVHAALPAPPDNRAQRDARAGEQAAASTSSPAGSPAASGTWRCSRRRRRCGSASSARASRRTACACSPRATSLPPAQRLAANVNPDLIASWEGGSNQLFVRDPGPDREHRSLTLARRPERRRDALGARGAAREGTVCFANLHASAGLPELATEELVGAAGHAVEWSGADPLVFGGDLNLRPARNPAAFVELRERFGLGEPTGPKAIDHLLARGLEVVERPRRLPAEERELVEPGGLRLRLSDHAPVDATFASRIEGEIVPGWGKSPSTSSRETRGSQMAERRSSGSRAEARASRASSKQPLLEQPVGREPIVRRQRLLAVVELALEHAASSARASPRPSVRAPPRPSVRAVRPPSGPAAPRPSALQHRVQALRQHRVQALGQHRLRLQAPRGRQEGRAGTRPPAEGAQGREDDLAERRARRAQRGRRGEDRRRVPRGASQEPDRPDGDGHAHARPDRGGAERGRRPRPHDRRRRAGARRRAARPRAQADERRAEGPRGPAGARSRRDRGPHLRSAQGRRRSPWARPAARRPGREAARCGRQPGRWRRPTVRGAPRASGRTSRSSPTTTSRRTRW